MEPVWSLPDREDAIGRCWEKCVKASLLFIFHGQKRERIIQNVYISAYNCFPDRSHVFYVTDCRASWTCMNAYFCVPTLPLIHDRVTWRPSVSRHFVCLREMEKRLFFLFEAFPFSHQFKLLFVLYPRSTAPGHGCRPARSHAGS